MFIYNILNKIYIKCNLNDFLQYRKSFKKKLFNLILADAPDMPCPNIKINMNVPEHKTKIS